MEMVQVENKTMQWFGASLDASSSAEDSTAIVVVRATHIIPNIMIYVLSNIMPMTHLPEIGAKTSTRKPVPFSHAFDMQFGAEFFWYSF